MLLTGESRFSLSHFLGIAHPDITVLVDLPGVKHLRIVCIYRETDRQTETERDTDRQTETDRGRDRQTDRQTDRDREEHRETERGRELKMYMNTEHLISKVHNGNYKPVTLILCSRASPLRSSYMRMR